MLSLYYYGINGAFNVYVITLLYNGIHGHCNYVAA